METVTMDQERWRRELERTLPPPEDRLGRNAAITATYARWYLDHPSLFKWAGMAVSASYIAGRYLQVLAGPPDGAGARLLPAGFRRKQADLLSSTNNGVFDDIAWTHQAFLSADGGLRAVEAGLKGRPTHQQLLEGFRCIDAGRRLLERDPGQATRLIRDGNRLLLKHEQEHTVQPFFTRFDLSFGLFLSATATADYRLGAAAGKQRWFPRFLPYMVRHARPLLRGTGTVLPDIRRLDHRWHWIDADALPCWMEIEASRQPAMLARFEALAAGGGR
jgi:hypothetical protein